MLMTILTVVLGLVLMVVLAGAIIQGAQVREDFDPLPPSAGLRPEDSERPGLLPHKLDPVTPDRPTYFASEAERISFALAAGRARRRKAAYDAWMADVTAEIDDMVGKVREGDC